MSLEPQTIALFGATGRTGSRVLVKALDAGYRVQALVRDPVKLSVTSPMLSTVVGDVTDPEAVAKVVAGADVVFSLFGQVRGSSPTLQTEGTRVMLCAMQTENLKRIVTLSGGALRAPGDKPKIADLVIRGLLRLISGHVLKDAESHLDALRASDTDWTVVRAPRLVESMATGRYRVGMVGVGSSTQISRGDLAEFIVTQVADRTHIHRLPFVSA